MAGKDWNNLGGDLNRIIEDAIHMGNFRHLNDNINRTLNRAFQGFAGGSRPAENSWDFNLSGQSNESMGGMGSSADKAADTYAYGGAEEDVPYASYTSADIDITRKELFAGKGKRIGGAIGMLIGGIALAGIGIATAIPFAVGLALGSNVLTLGSSMFVLFLGGGVFCILKAAGGMRLSGRFEGYVRMLGGKSYADIKSLAGYSHKSEGYVVKDLKKMLKKGWFIQGHLDHKDTCLMISDASYQQYLTAVENAKLRQEEEKRRRAEEAARGELSPEAKAIINKGKEYIDAIRKSNDEIPGEEISEKIYKMELLVKRIFEQAEKNPENIPDLRKLMEYYLPMTMKLLKAYEELDKQPVQGENVMTSKTEIENTLDTLNVAFAKLLDNLFRDTAWDVSSDISVLETMLAQEGLTEDNAFRKKQK